MNVLTRILNGKREGKKDGPAKAPSEQGRLQERLNELIKAGCEKSVIESFLIVLAVEARTGASDRIRIFPEHLTQRQLKYLPTRLRQMAKEIEDVNRNKFYDPEVWVPDTGGPEPSHGTVIKREFRILPRVLARYADFVELRTRLLGGFRKGPGRGAFFKRSLIQMLMKRVRESTGRPFYEALADLVSAALPEDSTYEYTAEALRQLDARHCSRATSKNSLRDPAR